MSDAALSQEVGARAARIRQRIADAGADPAHVTLLAVTKGFGVDAVAAALDNGLDDVGESYAQELAAKAEQIDRPARWHMIGGVQRNKVKQVAPFIHLWHSVDRLTLAGEIARRAPGAAVLVQVNAARLEHQRGCPPERVAAVVEGCTDLGLDVRGLMTIAPAGSPEGARSVFREVAALARALELRELSMGMTDDLEIAVQEGSTLVRVGTALFGPRRSESDMGQRG